MKIHNHLVSMKQENLLKLLGSYKWHINIRGNEKNNNKLSGANDTCFYQFYRKVIQKPQKKLFIMYVLYVCMSDVDFTNSMAFEFDVITEVFREIFKSIQIFL